MRRLLLARALRRGLFGGSRFWTVVGTLGVAMKLLRKITRDEPEVAFCEELRPGQTLLISNDRQATVVQRRR
ncbi:MAG TPA: hypothetical protein VHM89_16250 [Acidimicrobiales bacterium]|nr:hypothetical protein [Acidimicrobiales bacterium]